MRSAEVPRKFPECQRKQSFDNEIIQIPNKNSKLKAALFAEPPSLMDHQPSTSFSTSDAQSNGQFCQVRKEIKVNYDLFRRSECHSTSPKVAPNSLLDRCYPIDTLKFKDFGRKFRLKIQNRASQVENQISRFKRYQVESDQKLLWLIHLEFSVWFASQF